MTVSRIAYSILDNAGYRNHRKILMAKANYRLPLRNAKRKITIGPASIINATDVSWKITSQLIFANASNIFPPSRPRSI